MLTFLDKLADAKSITFQGFLYQNPGQWERQVCLQSVGCFYSFKLNGPQTETHLIR